MGNNTIFYILGAVVIIYLFISVTNRRIGKRRKDRKFLDGYNRKKKNDPED